MISLTNVFIVYFFKVSSPLHGHESGYVQELMHLVHMQYRTKVMHIVVFVLPNFPIISLYII